MKILDRILILILNLCLLIASIVGPALLLASSPAYYHYEFRKNGIYADTADDGTELRARIRYIGGRREQSAHFSDGQLDEIIDHIVTYLFEDGETFALTMDGVLLNGKVTDGVVIFGEAAVNHMADVRDLMQLGKGFVILSLALIPFLILYLILRRRACGRAVLRTTLFFYALLALAALVFLLVTVATSNGDLATTFWENAHHLFFPFQPEKVKGSFFNDTLTSILTLELFLDAVLVVLATAAVTLGAWVCLAFFLRRAED